MRSLIKILCLRRMAGNVSDTKSEAQFDRTVYYSFYFTTTTIFIDVNDSFKELLLYFNHITLVCCGVLLRGKKKRTPTQQNTFIDNISSETCVPHAVILFRTAEDREKWRKASKLSALSASVSE